MIPYQGLKFCCFDNLGSQLGWYSDQLQLEEFYESVASLQRTSGPVIMATLFMSTINKH